MTNQNIKDQKNQQNNPQTGEKTNQFDQKKDIGTTRQDSEKDVKPNEFPAQSSDRTSPLSDRL